MSVLDEGMRFSLVDASGSLVDLCGEGPFKAGIDPGLFGPPPVIDRGPSAFSGVSGTPSARPRSWGPRVFKFPIRVRSGSPAELYPVIERLARMLDPTVGAVRIIAFRPSGPPRELRCHLASSDFELRDNTDQATVVDLQFRADDPLWHDTEQRTDLVFSDLPVVSGHRQLDHTVDTQGSAETWPLWTISGPHLSVVATNLVGQQSRTWALKGYPTEAAGGGVRTIVDTRGFDPSIDVYGLTPDPDGGPVFVGSASIPAFHLLNPKEGVDLWPFAPRINTFSIRITGGDADTTVRCEFAPKHLTC